MLQFAYDTVLIYEASWNNLRCAKALLRGFELIYGLNINLCKSSLLSVNVEENFRREASSYLCYETGSIPFNFLGSQVGENHRRQDVWKPIIRKMKSRLSCGKGSSCLLGVESH